MRKKICYILLSSLFFSTAVFSQDSSLLHMLSDSMTNQGDKGTVTQTFKATQIINLPTVEAPKRNNMQFLIMHRFGKINDGAYEFFGLDNADIRLALDYGITDRFAIGIGRSSLDKTFDGSFKWKILQQSKRMPVTVSLYELITNTTLKYEDKPYLDAKLRTAYTSQLLIARKFSRNLSLQFSPAWTHYNLVPTPEDKNDVINLSLGGRMKITKRMSINAEYNYILPDQIVSTTAYNSLSLGLDIETGGHVFQLVFSNTQGMIGPWYLNKTTGTWGNGDIYFGFNISRSFNFNKEKEAKKW